MKYIRQVLIVMIVSFAGEMLNFLLPLPVPASIYGLVIMLICLLSGIIPLEAVRETGTFMVEIMPLMFIPAGAGLIDAWPALKPLLLPVAVIMVVSTVAVMAVSGCVTQFIMRRGKKDGGGQAV